jgi:tetratricopeptide (TPR) repeat protein
VIARTTIQRYVGAGKTLAEIGSAVGATHIVEGRVRRDGDRVRVTAQLTEVGRQTHVWAESYDRDIRDALIVQQEIALAIARAIDATLSTETPSIRWAGQVDAEAYQLYLKGRFFWNHRRPSSTIKAREYFEQALARDSAFARAYAGLGDIHLATGSAGAPAALDLARKALALDPSLGEAHATAGHAAMHTFDWTAAGASFLRAVQLDPGYTPARYLYAEYLVANGRFDEAIAQARRGVELDPAGSIANHALGTMYYYSRRYDEAIQQFNIALELDPSHRWSHSRLGQVYEQQGRYDAAMREFEAGEFPRPRARVSARAGQPREARQLVATSAPHEAALLLAALGEVERALDALERAVTPPGYDMVYLAVDPKLDALRSSPRFTKLLDRVGLPRVR